jgi:hypothetical protein
MLWKVIYHTNINYLFNRNRIKKIISDDNTYKIVFNLFQNIDYSNTSDIVKKDNNEIYSIINDNFFMFMILVKLLKINTDCKIQYNLLKLIKNVIFKKKQVDKEILIILVNDIYDYYDKIYNFKNIINTHTILEIYYSGIIGYGPEYMSINLDDIEQNNNDVDYYKIIINYIKCKVTNISSDVSIKNARLTVIINEYTINQDPLNIFINIFKYIKIKIDHFNFNNKVINFNLTKQIDKLIKIIIFYKKKNNFINFIIYLLYEMLNDLSINKYYFNSNNSTIQLLFKFYDDNHNNN